MACGLWAGLVSLGWGGAVVGQAQAGEAPHLSGADLHEWALLEQRRLAGAEAVQAYRAFALRWSESLLAEAAWDRLISLAVDPLEGAAPGERQRLVRVRARWMERRRALAAASRSSRRPAGVVDLDVSDAAVALKP